MGSTADRMYDALDTQAVAVRAAARDLRAVVEGSAEGDAVLVAATDLDEQASAARVRLETVLLGTLRAPIDRDDLYGLSCELDAACRAITRSIRHLTTSEAYVTWRPSTTKTSELVVHGSELICDAVGLLRHQAYETVVGTALHLRRARRDARTLYYDALLRLFDDPSDDPQVVFASELAFDHLDGVVAQLADVGSQLAFIATKNQ